MPSCASTPPPSVAGHGEGIAAAVTAAVRSFWASWECGSTQEPAADPRLGSGFRMYDALGLWPSMRDGSGEPHASKRHITREGLLRCAGDRGECGVGPQRAARGADAALNPRLQIPRSPEAAVQHQALLCVSPEPMNAVCV